MDFIFVVPWGIVSGILIFVSGLSYMKAIYTRKLERPVMSTLTLWFLIGLLLFLASVEAGVNFTTTLFPVLIGVVNPGVVLLLSFRYGTYSWKKLDILCTGICLITIAVWQTTDSWMLGLVGGIIADAVAATPIAVKCFKEPKDEPVFPWVLFAVGSAANLLAIKEWNIEYFLFPVYMSVMGLLISSPLIMYRIRTK